MGELLQEGRDRWERGRTWELLNATEEIERAALTCRLLGPTDSLGRVGQERASLAKMQTPEPCPRPENWHVQPTL